MQFKLFPKEKIIDSFLCKHRQKFYGNLHITNMRISFIKEEDESQADSSGKGQAKFSMLDIPLSDIESEEQIQSKVQETRAIMLINAKKKNYTFSFEGSFFAKNVEKVTETIKQAKAAFEQMEMGPQEMTKLTKLMGTPHLKDLFDELVKSGQISEDEFWDTIADIKYLSRKENEAQMDTGIRSASNPLLVFSNNKILDNSTAEINFKEYDAIRLLNEYPKLKKLYELKVSDSEESEKDFWDYFLKKNFEYKSEIFGGENPVYIGSDERDEKNYEDKHINIDVVMQADDNEEEINEKNKVMNRLRKADKCVNFILNKDDEARPEGYGDFQPTLNAEIRAGEEDEERDIKKLKNLEKEEIEMEKLMMKYNKYSERILSKNANDEIADKDIERYQGKDIEVSNDSESMGRRKYNSALNLDSVKKVSKSEQEENLKSIKLFSQNIKDSRPLFSDLSTCISEPKKAKADLEEMTMKSYRLTLRVNSDDIEKNIPPKVLQRQQYYQNKVDKLLELFYNMLPIDEQDKAQLKKIETIKQVILETGRSVNKIRNTLRENKANSKYASVYLGMIESLKVAVSITRNLQ
ncbi:unnamed protein product [Moneuplotes crassus]|uniref:BSD domain-containing protein n=1 Tax=Euplotes crassus TaxID=5936 RepID=A0AAD1X9G0_EUPCR|nr:unnamed protein product [Moneuplotes crassus]